MVQINSSFYFLLKFFFLTQKHFPLNIDMRYDQTLTVLISMINALHALLQSWGAVQHTVRLYNFVQHMEFQ